MEGGHGWGLTTTIFYDSIILNNNIISNNRQQHHQQQQRQHRKEPKNDVTKAFARVCSGHPSRLKGCGGGRSANINDRDTQRASAPAAKTMLPMSSWFRAWRRNTESLNNPGPSRHNGAAKANFKVARGGAASNELVAAATVGTK